MFDVTCLDSFGNVVNTFTQWDINQTLYIEDSGFDTAPVFHFCNQKSEKALCVQSIINSDGILTVKVPNQLLIEPYPVVVYVYMGSGDSYKTVEYMRFPLRTRPQPHDFEFSENVEVVWLKDLIEEVKELNETITEAENERVQHEAIRVSNENTRIANENARESAETDRETTESARVTAENIRKENENARKTAEINRSNAESTRSSNEQSRIENENARKAAETAREKAEQKREKDAYEVIDFMNGAKEGLIQATEDAIANAAESATKAKLSETNAAASANTATQKANAAGNSASSAATSAENSKKSETASNNSANTASQKSTEASNYATEAESFAHGSTGTRTGEDTDNAKYYYEQSKAITESFSGALRPMGTVAFASLPALSAASSGDMYNISDAFSTTADFKEGAGHPIPAGANIYKTADGKWDVLAGSPVTGVKGNAETAYRKGNVNLTPENIGALPTSGNAASATKLATAREIDGVKFDGSSSVGHYATCSTPAATAAKVAELANFALVTGSSVKVKFTVTNTAANPTLNVNNTGAKPIYYRDVAISAGYLAANRTYELVYNGTQYELVGDINTDIDNKVAQINVTDANDYRVLLSNSANDTNETKGAKKSTHLQFNPSTGALNSFGYDRQDITGATLDVNTLTLSAGTPHIQYYINKTNAGSTNITNLPVSGYPFILDVELIRWASTTDYVTRQTFKNSTTEWERTCTSGTWSAWIQKKFTDTNTTYGIATQLANGLMSADDKKKLDTNVLPLSGGTVTGTLVLSKTTDASGTANNQPALIIGGTVNQPHLEIDGNEIIAKSNAISTSDLNINLDGGTVRFGDAVQVGRFFLYDGKVYREVIRVFDDGDNENNGSELVIQGGGNSFIGSGESPTLLHSELLENGIVEGEIYNQVSEHLYLTSDNNTYIYSNAQTIANRKGIVFDVNGALRPLVDRMFSVGSSNNAWKRMYSEVFYSNIGGKNYGRLDVAGQGTEDTVGIGRLVLGNAITAGTDGNARGSIILFGEDSHFTQIKPDNPAADIILTLPTAGGTLARTADNVASATKLQTKRQINGTDFDGSAAITTGKWGTARTIGVDGDVVGSVSIDGSANKNITALRRGCIVSHEGTPVTKPWYKVASVATRLYLDK